MTWRAASGLPATGINWGPWSEVGVARSLTGSVLDPITPTEGIEALATLLGTDRSVTGVARLRTDRALAAFPEIRGLGYFSRVVEELDATDADGGDWAGVDSLHGVEPGEAKRIITDRLCVRMAAVMGYADPAAVDTTQPLTEMGLDSLMAVRIRNTARADFGVEPPVALLLQGATLGDVAADLDRSARPGRARGSGAGRPGPRSRPAAGRRTPGSRTAAEAGTTRVTAQSDWAAPGMTDARIPAGDFRKLGPINWVVNKIAAWVIGAPRMHLFATLGQHKLLFQVWFLFGAVLYAGRLPRPDTELVILRVAHLRGCEYELQQHRRFGARRGVRRRHAGEDLRLAAGRWAFAAPAGPAHRHRRVRHEADHQSRDLGSAFAPSEYPPGDRILPAGSAIRWARGDDIRPADPSGLPERAAVSPKVAIVTGASSGIGAAVARRLNAQGTACTRSPGESTSWRRWRKTASSRCVSTSPTTRRSPRWSPASSPRAGASTYWSTMPDTVHSARSKTFRWPRRAASST